MSEPTPTCYFAGSGAQWTVAAAWMRYLLRRDPLLKLDVAQLFDDFCAGVSRRPGVVGLFDPSDLEALFQIEERLCSDWNDALGSIETPPGLSQKDAAKHRAAERRSINRHFQRLLAEARHGYSVGEERDANPEDALDE